MRRDWRNAAIVSALLHAGFLTLGLDAIDSKPRALGHGLGPRGDFEVVALTPDQARRLLARRGSASVPLLAEAGGVGRSASSTPIPLVPPRPSGPDGAGLGGGPTLLELGSGRAGTAQTSPAPRPGVLGAPQALPAMPTPESGAPLDPNSSASEDALDPTEGPDEAGVGELAGSEGQHAEDTGASDGDRAIGLDAATADELVVFRVVPDYPPALARAGVGGQARFEFTVDDRGRVRDVERVASAGHSMLDTNAERALRRWRFDAAKVAARGWIGRRFRVTIDFRREDE